MKSITILSFLSLSIIFFSCQNDPIDPSSYSSIKHRFKIYKKNSFDSYCGSSGILKGDFIFGIDSENVTEANFGIPFGQFMDSLENANSGNVNNLMSFSYPNLHSGRFLNMIELRDATNNHDFSYFTSFSDTLVIDIDLNGVSYYDPFFYYSYYPDGTTNCPATSGSITFGTIDIDAVGSQGNDDEYIVENDTLFIITKYGI